MTVLFGQVRNQCFEHFDPLSYGVSYKISFADSTFEYEYIEGLSGGITKGKYLVSGDSIVLSSEFQQNDYRLKKAIDSSLSKKYVELKIRLIKYTQVIEVRSVVDNDSIIKFNAKLDIPVILCQSFRRYSAT